MKSKRPIGTPCS